MLCFNFTLVLRLKNGSGYHFFLGGGGMSWKPKNVETDAVVNFKLRRSEGEKHDVKAYHGSFS